MVFTVRLHKATGIAWVGFKVQHTVGVRIQNGITLDLFITWQTNHASISWRHLVQTFALQGWHERVGDKLQGLFSFERHNRRAGILLIGHGLCFVFASTSCAIALGLLRDHQIRIDMSFHMTRCIDRR